MRIKRTDDNDDCLNVNYQKYVKWNKTPISFIIWTGNISVLNVKYDSWCIKVENEQTYVQ